MIKKATLTALFLYIYLNAFCQDRITRINGDKLDCKITSIDTSRIEFLTTTSGNTIKTYIGLTDVSAFFYDGWIYNLDNTNLNALKFSKQQFSYSPDLILGISGIEKWKYIATGSGYFYTQEGNMFFMVYMTFENNSNSNQYIDFEQFYILDTKNDYRYPVTKILAKGIINRFYKKNKKIKPQSTLKLKAAFVCPDNFIPTTLLINGKICKIPKGI